MADTSDIQTIKKKLKFWNVSEEEAGNIDFHTDERIDK